MTTDAQLIAKQAADLLRMHGESAGRWAPRPHQVPPASGSFYGWLLLAGRGAGKTDACAKYVVDHIKGPPCLSGPSPHWVGIIAPTLGDAATSCFSGPSGIRAHDPSARLVNTIGGSVIRWPNGSEAKLFGANSEDDTERLRSGGNRCVLQGTLVRTEYGEIPIEDVRVGDRVWTRNGLRRVLRVWDNGIKEVIRYDHDAGSTWITPDHEVWTDRGWRAASLVEPSDTVYTWVSTESRSSMQTSRGTGIPPGTTPTAHTDYCTDGSTGIIMDRFRTTGRSTTKITTNRTTTRRIWRRVRRQARAITRLSIPNPGSGTAGVAGRRGTGRSPEISSAAGAVSSSSRGLRLEHGTALRSAGTLLLRHEHGSNGCAACAASHSSVRPVMQSVPVRGGALRSSHTSRVGRVYDLTVEHDHEFFANDLLSSNCLQWLEELAAWRYLDAAWAQMRFGLRAGPHPHWVGSTTPKPRQLIKRLDRGEIGRVVISRATMYDNPHLPAEIREALEDEYGGTQLGRQELLGQLIDEDEMALWKHRTIDAARVARADLPVLGRISVGVDPSGGAGEQGIVVAARSKLILPPTVMPQEEDIEIPGSSRPNKHGYVLDDRTVHLSPDGWGRAVVKAAVDWEADEIFVETNYGGAMCVSTIRSAAESKGISIPIKVVTATRGKKVRAEPVSALTSQGRWHHAGEFEALEDQMCLVAGTLVETGRGHVPVEAVLPGDRVMTREGFAPVVWSGQTGVTQDLVSIQLDECVLESTPWHPIYDPRQGRFVPAMNVRPGQLLAVRPSPAGTEIPSRGAVAGGTWSHTGTTVTPKGNCSTGRFTHLTSARSWTAATSTTGMRTPATISPGIWSPVLRRNTLLNTLPGVSGSIPLRSAVPGVGLNGQPDSPGPLSVPSAEGNSGAPGSGRNTAVGAVSRRSPGVGVPVYNLTVAEGWLPEFYANGILVHNCTWHDDLDWSPDRLDAAVWNGWGLRLAHLMSSGQGSMGGGGAMSKKITPGRA
jgi:phage terminase large subunit-like protein